MPTFGQDRIRRFWHDVSSCKRIPAREYEAFLIVSTPLSTARHALTLSSYQVMIPAFEGLLPLKHNQTVLQLLYELAHFHSLAKLRMQTEVMLDLLESATSHVYAAMRKFAQTTCTAFDTYERPDEVDKRRARALAKKKDAAVDITPRKKLFNVLSTYKYHAIGDYAKYIRRSGPTSCYSTQTVRLTVIRARCFLRPVSVGRVRAPPRQVIVRSYK